MPKYIARLKDKRTVADGTMAFVISRPEGFIFKAGQNADFTLLNFAEQKLGGRDAIRTFSFASAPSEVDLTIATRMRDTVFKNILKTLPDGANLQIDGPYGNMTLQVNAARPAVMLAGGIGITPFRSMAREAAAQKLPHKLFLFYSNRAPKDAPFLAELKELEAKRPNFRLVVTMTDDTSWPGEKGYISKEMIEKHIADVLSPIYYLAGSPMMTGAMHKMLSGFGISDDDIRMEEFAGY